MGETTLPWVSGCHKAAYALKAHCESESIVAGLTGPGEDPAALYEYDARGDKMIQTELSGTDLFQAGLPHRRMGRELK